MTDGLGQEGRSETIRVTLPAREFISPISLDLIELRRLLAQDSRNQGIVADRLEDIVHELEAGLMSSEQLETLRSVYDNLMTSEDPAVREQASEIGRILRAQENYVIKPQTLM